VIELLLDAGSDIEQTDQAGAAPLHRAVRARSPEAVRCLLVRGARVDATHGRQRTTPLHTSPIRQVRAARRERAPSSKRSWSSFSSTAPILARGTRTATSRGLELKLVDEPVLILMDATK
jgi:ankyrin repeat protein